MSAVGRLCLGLADGFAVRGVRFYAKDYGKNKRLKPLSMRATAPEKPLSDADAFYKRIEPEVLDSIKTNPEDEDLEMNENSINGVYSEYRQELFERREKFKRKKMIRKHFNPFIKKEVNLLTYAEKEKIRFLHYSDPEQWNSESLSSAFPISEKGALGIIKSGFRLTNPDDIRRHDESIIEKLNMIRSGQIPLDEELEAKLKIRDQIPIRPGLPSMEAANLTRPKKPLGEFGKLVAQSKSKSSPEPLDSGLLLKGDGSNFIELELPPDTKRNFKELRELDIDHSERMTLEDFEQEVKSGHERRGRAPKPEVDYLLQLSERPTFADKMTDENMVQDFSKPTSNDFMNFGSIPKFKNYRVPQNEKIEFTVERDQPYFYDAETGTQKPYAPSTSSESIEVPEENRKHGTVFKVGDSYYDADGEFLYRVV